MVENDEIKKSIETKLNDAELIPQGVSYSSCSWQLPSMPFRRKYPGDDISLLAVRDKGYCAG